MSNVSSEMVGKGTAMDRAEERVAREIRRGGVGAVVSICAGAKSGAAAATGAPRCAEAAWNGDV